MLRDQIGEKKGFVSSLMVGDPIRALHTRMLVRSTTLNRTRSGDKSDTVVATMRLMDIQVRVFESDLIEDHGMKDYGFVDDSKERVKAIIGLRPELAVLL